MSERKRELPPLPVPPKRSLTPPEKRKAMGAPLDADTPARNPTAASFAALASVFDELSPEQRVEFVELGFLFRDLPSAFRKKIIEAAQLATSRRR